MPVIFANLSGSRNSRNKGHAKKTGFTVVCVVHGNDSMQYIRAEFIWTPRMWQAEFLLVTKNKQLTQFCFEASNFNYFLKSAHVVLSDIVKLLFVMLNLLSNKIYL